ncbi:EamA family transporter [Patescibacteria group bacterium]|nr:EamA family transporter [Patescibacteria group bacterium]
MTTFFFLELTIIALLNAAAQVFIKKASIVSWFDWSTIFNKNLWLGGLLYVVGFFLWVKALNQGELTFIVPFTTSLMYIATIFFGWYFFREQITTIRVVGILVICVGMFLVMKK